MCYRKRRNPQQDMSYLKCKLPTQFRRLSYDFKVLSKFQRLFYSFNTLQLHCSIFTSFSHSAAGNTNLPGDGEYSTKKCIHRIPVLSPLTPS